MCIRELNRSVSLVSENKIIRYLGKVILWLEVPFIGLRAFYREGNYQGL